MKSPLKKISYWIQHLDGIWSVPLAFTAFWLVGIFLQFLGSHGKDPGGVGSYDLAFIQPLFLACGIVIGATNAAIWGLFFTFRGLYRYLYGKLDSTGHSKNYSKENWSELTAWQRYLVAFFVYFYYATAIIVVYLKLV